jgi:hypothetical protein
MRLSIPIYVTLTSIYQNQDVLCKTLKSILGQTILPNCIYVYLSKDAYLLDSGFKDNQITNEDLRELIKSNSLIQIQWVDNIGPYRKLLPLLQDKWNEDCILITIDDDTEYHPNLIKNMTADYEKQQCVINYRGFSPRLTHLHEFDYTNRQSIIHKWLYNFPTGKGGCLYHPKFFHKSGDLIFNKNIYLNHCKTADDVWFYLIRIINQIPCYINNTTFEIHDNTTKYSLFRNYNSANNQNTTTLHDCIIVLELLNLSF